MAMCLLCSEAVFAKKITVSSLKELLPYLAKRSSRLKDEAGHLHRDW